MTRYENLNGLAKAVKQEQPKHGELQAEARHRVGPGFATVAEAARYLRLNPRRVGEVLKAHDAPLNPAGRVRWTTLWGALWQIHQVPETAYDIMMQPLLTVAEVAEHAGVCERSILRDTDRQRPHYGLPRFVQLSERARRFHPTMINCWDMQETIEDWMQVSVPAPRLPRGLRPRGKLAKLAVTGSISDSPAVIGKNDIRPLV